MNTPEEIAYHDNVNCKFSEAVYQEMASKRYGIDFCCQPDLTEWAIKKELSDLNAIGDAQDNLEIPGKCEQVTVSAIAVGGNVMYRPCGAFKDVVLPVAGASSEIICYDSNYPVVIEQGSDLTASTPVPCAT